MRTLLAWTLLTMTCALAQPKRPEVFGQIGVFRDGGDEGSLGTGVSVGGSAMIPFAERWAADIAVHSFQTDLTIGADSTTLRSILFLPAVAYRRGSEKAYFFIGGGVGAEQARSRFRASGQAFGFTSNGMLVHWRTGFVANPARQVLIRFDLIMAHRYVLPNVGATIGVGYRF